jgi:hypothetical protein
MLIVLATPPIEATVRPTRSTNGRPACRGPASGAWWWDAAWDRTRIMATFAQGLMSELHAFHRIHRLEPWDRDVSALNSASSTAGDRAM